MLIRAEIKSSMEIKVPQKKLEELKREVVTIALAYKEQPVTIAELWQQVDETFKRA